MLTCLGHSRSVPALLVRLSEQVTTIMAASALSCMRCRLQVAGLWLVLAFFTGLGLLLLALGVLCSKRRSWGRVKPAPHTAGAHLPRLKSTKTMRSMRSMRPGRHR